MVFLLQLIFLNLFATNTDNGAPVFVIVVVYVAVVVPVSFIELGSFLWLGLVSLSLFIVSILDLVVKFFLDFIMFCKHPLLHLYTENRAIPTVDISLSTFFCSPSRRYFLI